MKIKVYKCEQYHFGYIDPLVLPPRRPIDNYWHVKETKKGNLVYRCKECLEKKQEVLERNKRLLPDDYVANKLIKGTKLKPEDIPPALIEAKKETMRLDYMLKHPVKKCAIHGNLYVHKQQVIKSGIVRGKQQYKCKACMKTWHDIYYHRNKEKVLSKSKTYREKNKEKVKEIKRISFAQNYDKYKDKILERNARFRANNRDKLAVKNRERKKNYVETLHDVYIKRLLMGGTSLKSDDIPQSLIEFKRAVELMKRKINDVKSDDRMAKIQEILDELENKKY